MLNPSSRTRPEFVIGAPTAIAGFDHVPDDLHQTLKVRAAENGQSLSDYLIAQIRDIAQRPTPGEMRYRLAERTQVRVRESSVRAVRAERQRQRP